MTSGINYELIEGGKRGRLLADEVYTDSISGYVASFNNGDMRCRLFPCGDLVVYAGTIWDFGTFAIDTPAMVIASLEHDCFCSMTNARVLPWSVRWKADKNFFKRLGSNGDNVSKWWRTGVVMTYSQLFARWKDKC